MCSSDLALWERKLPDLYSALNKNWSESVGSIMEAVKAKTQARFVSLVGNSYSSISLPEFANYVGLPSEEALQLAKEQPGWSYDDTRNLVLPVKLETAETESIPSEQQLQLLTDFVAFLEK